MSTKNSIICSGFHYFFYSTSFRWNWIFSYVKMAEQNIPPFLLETFSWEDTIFDTSVSFCSNNDFRSNSSHEITTFSSSQFFKQRISSTNLKSKRFSSFFIPNCCFNFYVSNNCFYNRSCWNTSSSKGIFIWFSWNDTILCRTVVIYWLGNVLRWFLIFFPLLLIL